MNAKETLAEIKELGLLRAGNLQEKLNVMAVSFEEELIELRGKCDALQTSQDNIINGLGIKGDGPVSKLVLERFIAIQAKFEALVAEGTVMRDAINQTIGWQESIDPQNTESVRLLVSLKTPATDAEFAEIKVQGVDALASTLWSRANELVSEGAKKSIVIQTRVAAKLAEEFAANLHAGRKG